MWTVGDMLRQVSQRAQLDDLLMSFGITLTLHDDAAAIPGSYWGPPEAGIIAKSIHARADTPLHSLLHEACHLICMGETRSAKVFKDAGGSDDEEAAVCFLQLCLADRLPLVGWRQLAADMDAWGYSFPSGNTAAWFETDADDAHQWLVDHQLSDWLIARGT